MKNIAEITLDEIPFDDMKALDTDERTRFYYECVHKYRDDLSRWIKFKAPSLDEELVEELRQETIERALVSRHQLRNTEECKTWLFSIAANVVAGHFKKEKRWNKIRTEEYQHMASHLRSREPEEEFDMTLDEVLRNCRTKILMESLLELKPDQQYVIRMRHMEGMKFREIAKLTGLPMSTINSKYRNGCKNLKALIEEKEGLDDDE